VTHHVHILSMNGESYRLAQSARSRKLATTDANGQSAVDAFISIWRNNAYGIAALLL
jgi:hypothetical protein